VHGPLFLPLSARGFLVLLVTIRVEPLAELTPELMKAPASGRRDVDGSTASVDFRLAGTVEGEGGAGEGGVFSLPVSGSVQTGSTVDIEVGGTGCSGSGEGARGGEGGAEEGSCAVIVGLQVDSTAVLKRSLLHFSNSAADSLRKRVEFDSKDAISTEISFREAMSLGLQNFSSGQSSRTMWYFSVMKWSKLL